MAYMDGYKSYLLDKSLKTADGISPLAPIEGMKHVIIDDLPLIASLRHTRTSLIIILNGTSKPSLDELSLFIERIKHSYRKRILFYVNNDDHTLQTYLLSLGFVFKSKKGNILVYEYNRDAKFIEEIL